MPGIAAIGLPINTVIILFVALCRTLRARIRPRKRSGSNHRHTKGKLRSFLAPLFASCAHTEGDPLTGKKGVEKGVWENRTAALKGGFPGKERVLELEESIAEAFYKLLTRARPLYDTLLALGADPVKMSPFLCFELSSKHSAQGSPAGPSPRR